MSIKSCRNRGRLALNLGKAMLCACMGVSSLVGPLVMPSGAQPLNGARTGEPVERVSFAAGDASLTSQAKTDLAMLADRLRGNGKRLELIAYASAVAAADAAEETGSNQEASAGSNVEGRRLALARLLAVRTYLLAQGLDATQMDVRALLKTAPDGDGNLVVIWPASTRTVAPPGGPAGLEGR